MFKFIKSIWSFLLKRPKKKEVLEKKSQTDDIYPIF